MGGVVPLSSGRRGIAPRKRFAGQFATRCSDIAAMGVVLRAAGLASTAPGAVLLYRDRSGPVVPIATVADDHVLISLNGAF